MHRDRRAAAAVAGRRPADGAFGVVHLHDRLRRALAAVAPDLDLQEELELRMSDPTFFIVAAVSLCTVAAWLGLRLHLLLSSSSRGLRLCWRSL